MSTISKEKEPLEWGKWGKEGEKPPGMKDLVELMITQTNTSKKILEETREWLIQNGKSNQ
jgi:hypothetical protein